MTREVLLGTISERETGRKLGLVVWEPAWAPANLSGIPAIRYIIMAPGSKPWIGSLKGRGLKISNQTILWDR